MRPGSAVKPSLESHRDVSRCLVAPEHQEYTLDAAQGGLGSLPLQVDNLLLQCCVFVVEVVATEGTERAVSNADSPHL